MATIRTNKRKNPFVQIDKTVLNDERLSFKAKGLAAYLLSKPDNWEANYRHLAKVGADGETAVRSGMQELEDAGYLIRSRHRRDDGTFEWEAILFEEPQPDYPCVENPSLDNPSLDNHRNNNNRVVNNERTISSNSNAGEAEAASDKPTPPPPPTEGEIFTLWQNEIGALSSIISEQVGDLIDDYGTEEVEYAIKQAVKGNARNYNYVAKVCENRKAGFDPRKKGRGGRGRKGSVASKYKDKHGNALPDYENRPAKYRDMSQDDYEYWFGEEEEYEVSEEFLAGMAEFSQQVYGSGGEEEEED